MGPQLPPQLPITTPKRSCTYIYIYIFKMLREKGKEWNHVRVIELKDMSHQHKVECKYCKYVFVGSASSIRRHLLHINPVCE